MTTDGSSAVFAGNQWKLSLAQLFSGVGIAVGFAVGGLLAEDLTGQAEYAGFAQTASIIGAGVLAIPLARLAARHSRRHSLTLGFAIALAGAVTILAGARLGSPVIFFVGMFLFGSATATGLQTRYAATDDAPPHLRGRALSIVVWATTIGSVAGPNLAGPGGVVGERLGVGELGGPFALSAIAFAVAIGFTMLLRRSAARRLSVAAGVASGGGEAPPVAPPAKHASLAEAMRIVLARPRALLGFAAVVLGHTVMVSVMVMTPVHMSHHGDSIEVIGIVISMHILGMYALSPVYGYLSDRFGPVPVIWAGFAILTAAAALGILDDAAGSSMPRISTALTLLGLGWSACFIAGSTLLTASVPESHRVVIQGAADAGMNLGAAAFAAAAGPLLAVGGFTLINIAALGIVAVGVAVAVRSLRAHRRAEAAAQAGG